MYGDPVNIGRMFFFDSADLFADWVEVLFGMNFLIDCLRNNQKPTDLSPPGDYRGSLAGVSDAAYLNFVHNRAAV